MKAHSAVKVSDTQIFIFGGFNEKKICTDNSILLDVENGTIVEFETRGVKPSARAYSVKKREREKKKISKKFF